MKTKITANWVRNKLPDVYIILNGKLTQFQISNHPKIALLYNNTINIHLQYTYAEVAKWIRKKIQPEITIRINHDI